MSFGLAIAFFLALKWFVMALAKRHSDGSVPLQDYNLELEDQSGQKVNIGTETDQRSIMMGLMLHSKGKQLIESREYKDALEVLTMGEASHEEAFSLCDSKLIERVDNVSILQTDIVWCYFMLRDISLLSAAGIHLAKARKEIELAHGKDASSVSLLQGGSSPELALYLRLDLLEGIVAYYGGHLEKSRQLLTSARMKLSKLAAEALIRCENDFRKALDILTNSDLNSEMQVTTQARKSKSEDQAKGAVLVLPGVTEAASTSGSSSASTSLGEDDLDLEMEEQLAGALEGVDALSDYDIDAQ
ncbi:NEDD8 ultimate buster 1-like protein [Drosera capensis]